MPRPFDEKHLPSSAPPVMVLERGEESESEVFEGDSEEGVAREEGSSESPLEVPPGMVSDAPVEMPPRELVYRSASRAVRNESLAQNVMGDIRFDRSTGQEGVLNYHAVFDPSVVPMKRNNARDSVGVDYGLGVASPTLLPVEIVGREGEGGRALFWGSFLLDLEAGQPAPIPSVSPESRILETFSDPPVEALQFSKDGGDNFYVQAPVSGRVRLQVLMDASDAYFAREVEEVLPIGTVANLYPDGLPALPGRVREAAPAVWRAIGVNPDMALAEALSRLVAYYRSFEPGAPPEETKDIYLDIALSRRGVCRHRSHAFVVTALSLGLPARFVSNEAHAFVEVWTPDGGWLRIDLGGGAEGMEVHGGEERRRHAPARPDPFEQPEQYARSYSGESLSGGQSGFDFVRGLPRLESLAMILDGNTALEALLREERNTEGHRAFVTEVATSIFRGEEMRVNGRVENLGGDGISSAPVVVFLLPAGQTTQSAIQIGSGWSSNQGLFEVKAHVPDGLTVGRYLVIAKTL